MHSLIENSRLRYFHSNSYVRLYLIFALKFILYFIAIYSILMKFAVAFIVSYAIKIKTFVNQLVSTSLILFLMSIVFIK